MNEKEVVSWTAMRARLVQYAQIVSRRVWVRTLGSNVSQRQTAAVAKRNVQWNAPFSPNSIERVVVVRVSCPLNVRGCCVPWIHRPQLLDGRYVGYVRYNPIGPPTVEDLYSCTFVRYLAAPGDEDANS